MIVFGAGVVGEAVVQACRTKDIPVACVLDDRVTGSCQGVPILRTEMLNGFEGPIYLTSPNIDDMVQKLKVLGRTDWRSFKELVEDIDLSTLDWKGHKYSVEHIKYLVRTALHHQDNYLHPERLTVQSVDLVITERCSMKCKDCANLMQYYERPENADLNETLQSIDDLCSKMDEIYEVRVIGGEPFMNKELHLIVEAVTKKENVRKVSIFTNATIMPREHQWPSLKHPKVYFFITEYLQSRALQPLVAELTRKGIAYVSEKANDWTDSGSLDKRNRSKEENEQVFAECCAKNLATLADGYLYRCPFAAHARKLGATPLYEEDFREVSKVGKEAIRSFLRDKTMIETCDHCNGRSYGQKVIEAAIQTKIPLKYRKYELKAVHGT